MRGHMIELSPANAGIRFNRFLPYWAVLQTDLRQTLRSWVYRLWVLMSVLGACGSLIYRVGIKEETGIVQTASSQTQNLLRGLVIVLIGALWDLSVLRSRERRERAFEQHAVARSAAGWGGAGGA